LIEFLSTRNELHMTTEAGGSTTQSGIFYQNTVAALYLGRMLDPRISDLTQRVIAVRVEAREYVDDVLVMFADSHHRFIQAKENIDPTSGNKKWRKLWEDFEKQRWDTGFKDEDRLVIYLGKSDEWFSNLNSLCERARGARNLDEWQDILSNKTLGELECKIRQLLSLEHQNLSDSLKLLSVVEVEQKTLNDLESFVINWMPPNNKGEQILFSTLRDLCGKSARIKIEMDASTLCAQLKDKHNIELFPAPISIENNLITGSVCFDDGRPVEYACVRVIGLDLDQVNTGSDGYFKFMVGDQPSWTIQASYKDRFKEIKVNRKKIGQPIIIKFPLLASFSVDSPEENDEIPLGEKQTRVLEGSFPILADGSRLAETASVEVEVRTYPEGVPIIQNGECKISLYQGKWRYESAQFDGEGIYDVTATASIGKNEDFRSVRVNCTQKDKYYQRAIEEDLKIRGITRLPSTKPEDINLDRVRFQFKQILYNKQVEFFDYFSNNDLEHASLTINSTLEIVDQILPVFLPKFPDDLWLQQVRAYTFKNYAMLMRAYHRDDEFSRGLSEAEKTFKAIRDQDPKEAGAWNGLGSIAALRGDYQKALVYIDIALEINPQYEAALRDRETMLKYVRSECRNGFKNPFLKV